MRDNTSKYESVLALINFEVACYNFCLIFKSLDAFDKWAEEYERKTQSIQEMKLVIEECEKKLNEMARVEMEKREKFEKEYAKFLPDELMIECPV